MSADPATIIVTCESCGDVHVGEYSHQDRFRPDTAIYEVACTKDGLSDFFNASADETRFMRADQAPTGATITRVDDPTVTGKVTGAWRAYKRNASWGSLGINGARVRFYLADAIAVRP